MAVTIEYDSALEKERHEALQEGLVWCQRDEATGERIDVWWPPEKNRKDASGDRPMSKKLKSIGGKGTENGGGWLTLTLTNCRALRSVFGDDLEISEDLDEWAFTENERLSSIDNLSTAASDAPTYTLVKEEAPAIARMAHPYQRAGIAFIERTRRALLADQPGLGKTLQTIGAIIAADLRGDILICAPSAAVAITWPDELRTWAPGEEVIAVMGAGPKRKKILRDALSVDPVGKRRWFIVNLEMARAEWVKPSKEKRRPKNQPTAPERWFKVPGWWDYKYEELYGGFREDDDFVECPPWAAIVVDESHRCLICHTAFAQGQTQVRAGMGQLKVQEGGIKLALSGTPMRGKAENLWGTLNWLYPDLYTAYWTWVKMYFNWMPTGDTPDSDLIIEGLDEAKATAFYQDIKPIMLRRTKKEVRPELPDKLYAGTPLPDENGMVDEHSPVGHWIHMSPKQAKAYSEIQEDAATILESGVLYANGLLAELTRLKQFSTTFGDLEHYLDSEGESQYKFIPQLPSAKFDWLLEFLDDLGINKNSSMEIEEDGEQEIRKVVVASQFTSILRMYEAELSKRGIESMSIHGKISPAERKRNKDRWQEAGGPRVFLLNTSAGGVSLTLDAADDLVFLDETWIPDEQEQVEDRIHRVSRMHQVTIHYLRALGTIEENIALVTGSRERVTKLLLDGERGVGFAKKLLTPIKRD